MGFFKASFTKFKVRRDENVEKKREKPSQLTEEEQNEIDEIARFKKYSDLITESLEQIRDIAYKVETDTEKSGASDLYYNPVNATDPSGFEVFRVSEEPPMFERPKFNRPVCVPILNHGMLHIPEARKLHCRHLIEAYQQFVHLEAGRRSFIKRRNSAQSLLLLKNNTEISTSSSSSSDNDNNQHNTTPSSPEGTTVFNSLETSSFENSSSNENSTGSSSSSPSSSSSSSSSPSSPLSSSPSSSSSTIETDSHDEILRRLIQLGKDLNMFGLKLGLDHHDLMSVPELTDTTEGLTTTSQKRLVNEAIVHYLTDDRFIVLMDSLDPDNPRNWTAFQKIKNVVAYALVCMIAQLGCGMLSPASDQIIKLYNISPLIAPFVSSVYFLGMALGPPMMTPLADLIGRARVTMIAFCFGVLVTTAASGSKYFSLLIVWRFIYGVCASAPIVLAGSSIADSYQKHVRGIAIAFNSMSIVFGPACSCLFGSLILRSNFSWEDILHFYAVVCLITAIIFYTMVKESNPKVILRKKASFLRKLTGNNMYRSEWDIEQLSFWGIMIKYFKEPLCILGEPVVLIMCLYNGFAFGLYIMFSISVFNSFRIHYNWGILESCWPCLSVAVGAVIGGIIHLLLGQWYLKMKVAKTGEYTPEYRLMTPSVMSWLMTVGMLTFGYSVEREFHWVWACTGLVFLGMGFLTILQGSLNYLVDAFPQKSSACLSCNAMIRALFACCMPIFSTVVFKKKEALKKGFFPLASTSFLLSIALAAVFCFGKVMRKSKKLQPKKSDFDEGHISTSVIDTVNLLYNFEERRRA